MTRILITGVTSGIGRESARQLAAEGHELVLVGRSRAKLDEVAAEVRAAGAGEVTTLVADFESLQSVRELADTVLARFDRLDVLVNNAGTVYAERRLTADGHEATFAVNHLAGFLLTERLKPLLVASAPARVVNTASVGHYQATMDFDDLGFEKGYFVMRSYARSKLANVLYTRSLAAELEGTGVTVNALHPGAVATSIWSGAPRYARPVLALATRFMRTPADGGRRITYLATNPEVEGRTGLYFHNDKPRTPSKLALDGALAARLRDESARLVGLEENK